MKKNNFNIIQENKIDLKLEVNKYASENITKFTLVGWIFDIFTQNYIRNKINIPKKFLKNMTQVECFMRMLLLEHCTFDLCSI